jgi:hypothetical protein
MTLAVSSLVSPAPPVHVLTSHRNFRRPVVLIWLIDYFRLARHPSRVDAKRGDPSYKLAYQALAAFPTHR